jgi:hypothetical protein
MAYALAVPSQVDGSYEPRSPSPLSGRRIAEERAIEHQQVLVLKAPDAPLPVSLRNEVVPMPDALWQRLSGEEIFSRAEGHSQPVTWEEFLTTM